jgi:hypothetical protein
VRMFVYRRDAECAEKSWIRNKTTSSISLGVSAVKSGYLPYDATATWPVF